MVYYYFRDAERKINLFKDTLIPKANQSLNVVQKSYVSGGTEFLSLIDAERLLLEFELSYERAVANRMQRLAELEMLVGTPLSSSKELKQ
jgi:cobalt-zinc-cadmium efflux system outer membrane protein